MYIPEKYQMTVRGYAPYGHPEWPSKKIYFDASEWLKQKDQYIKVDDTRLLNLKYEPLEVNEDAYYLIGIMERMITSRVNVDPGLKSLADLAGNYRFDKAFLASDVHAQYLYSEFDDTTRKPTEDYFLISFTYEEKPYYAVVFRSQRPSNETGEIETFLRGHVFRRNKDFSFLTYEKYMAQQKKKNDLD